MSNWLIKSESNFKATNKLNNDSFFASSIHCSYYSCIQMMYHFLSTYLNKSDQQIKDDTYNSSSQIGLHNWLIKTVFDEFKDSTEANDFNTKINELKLLRGKSDYQNKIIILSEAETARNTAYHALSILKRNFNL